jgi:hypothetical protein
MFTNPPSTTAAMEDSSNEPLLEKERVMDDVQPPSPALETPIESPSPVEGAPLPLNSLEYSSSAFTDHEHQEVKDESSYVTTETTQSMATMNTSESSDMSTATPESAQESSVNVSPFPTIENVPLSAAGEGTSTDPEQLSEMSPRPISSSSSSQPPEVASTSKPRATSHFASFPKHKNRMNPTLKAFRNPQRLRVGQGPSDVPSSSAATPVNPGASKQPISKSELYLNPNEIARPQKFAPDLLVAMNDYDKTHGSAFKETNFGPAKRRIKTWGDHLAQSKTKVTYEPWIVVTDIPPTSSMEATLNMIQSAINEDLLRGIVDLDALFIPRSPPPMLRTTQEEINSRKDRFPHILEARLILSPFARPRGWYVRLAHRSLAQSLLVRQRQGTEFVVSSRIVNIQPYTTPKPGQDPFPGSYSHVSDATVRVENCPPGLTKLQFWNFFSRFDLSMDYESVVQWKGQTPDGKLNPSDTFIVQFADPSWARAAIRERQGERIRGWEVRLSQYPRQLVS